MISRKDVPLVGEPEIEFISLTGMETTSAGWILEYINSPAGSGFDYAGLQHAERLLRVQQHIDTVLGNFLLVLIENQ